jgi:trehalose/maltose transport system substrate-binding protein
MNRKWYGLHGIILIVYLALAACSAGIPAPMEEEARAGGKALAEDAATGDAVSITYLGHSPGIGADFTKQQIEQFMAEHPDINVEFVEGPNSVTDRYGLLLQTFEAQSNDIDVIDIDVIWPGDLAEHLVDLNEYGAADVTGDHFVALVVNNTVDGALVGMPWYTSGGMLYYRTDLLEKYGYDGPPATWDELEEMAQTIMDGERAEGNQDFWGYVWQGAAYEGLTCDALEWVHSSDGGTIISPEKIITINNENAAAALDRAAGWVGTISPPAVTAFMEEDSRAVWQGGNAAFMRNWAYAYGLGNAEDSVIAGLFDVTSLPGAEAGQSAAVLGGWQVAVSKHSDNVDAAAQLALWLTSKASQKDRAINLSLLPTIPALYEDAEIAEAAPFMPNLLSVFTNAVARPSTASAPNYNEVSNIFFSNASDVLNGKQSGEEAVAVISLELGELLGFEIE